MGLKLRMLNPIAVVAAAAVLAVPATANAVASASTWAGTMTDSRVDESSSLAVSTAFPGIAYTANDENDPIYAIEIGTGRVVGSARLVAQTMVTKKAKVWAPKRKYAGNPAVTCQTKKQRKKMCKKFTRQVPVATAATAGLVDPEAMATDSAGTVWLADTGDNDLQRHGGALYAFSEPGTGDHATPATRYPIVYPGGVSYNVETLLINPVTNAKYLVSKTASGAGKLFGLPKALSTTTPNLAVDTGVTTIPAMISDGDFSPRGTRVILRNGTPSSQEAYVFNASTWARLNSITNVPNASSGKGESVSFDPKATRFLTSREGNDAPLYWVSFDEATWK